MGIFAIGLGVWWLWWLRQPDYGRPYRAKDKRNKRVCV